MNRKVLKVVFVAAIAMVASINVFNAQKAEVLSDVAMANVEALADEEWTNGACYWISQYTICDYVGTYQGCPCGSRG